MALRVRADNSSSTVSAIRQVLSASDKSKQKSRKTSSFAQDAVGRSIDLMKAVSSIGSATPVPWISAAADAITSILQVIQQADRNREDLESLAEGVLVFITILRNVTAGCDVFEEDYALDLKQDFIDVTEILVDIHGTINEMYRDHGRLKALLRKDSVASKIKMLQRRVDLIQRSLQFSSSLQTQMGTRQLGHNISLVSTQLGIVSEHILSVRNGPSTQLQAAISATIIPREKIEVTSNWSTIKITREEHYEVKRKLTKRQRRMKRHYGYYYDQKGRIISSVLVESVTVIDSLATVIVDGESKQRWVRAYQGRDAQSRFKADLALFKSHWSPNLPQVFGVSDQPSSPAIVFHDRFTLTAKQYLNSCSRSRPLEPFLFHLKTWVQFEKNEFALCQYLEELGCQTTADNDNVLIDPTTGEFLFTNIQPTFSIRGYISTGCSIWSPVHLTAAHFSLLEIDALIHGLLQKDLLLRANKTSKSNIQIFIDYCLALAQTRLKNDFWRPFVSQRPSAKGLDVLSPSMPAQGDIRVIEEVDPRGFNSSYSKLGHVVGYSPIVCNDVAYKEFGAKIEINRITIDGQAWNRLDIRDPTNLDCSMIQSFESSMSSQRAWLAHAHSTMARFSRQYAPEEYCIVQLNIYGLLYKPKPMLQDIEFSLRNTFMDPNCVPSSTPSIVYIFYRHIEFDDQGRVQPPEMFWTSDVTGQRRWSEQELENYLAEFNLSPGKLNADVYWKEISWPWYVYDMIRDVQKACGFDPASDEFADFLGIPSTYRVEIESSEMRFEAQDNLSSATEAGIPPSDESSKSSSSVKDDSDEQSSTHVASEPSVPSYLVESEPHVESQRLISDESSTDPTSDPAPTPQNEPVAAIVARSSSEAVLFAQPSSKSENAEDGSSFAGIPPGVDVASPRVPLFGLFEHRHKLLVLLSYMAVALAVYILK